MQDACTADMDGGFSSEPTQLFLCVQLLFYGYYFRNNVSLFLKINLNLPPRTRENRGLTETLCQPQAARHVSVVLLDHARSIKPTTFD